MTTADSFVRELAGIVGGGVVMMATPMFAQSGTSAIAGLVKDASGAAVPGASVKVANEETGIVVDTISNGDGLYRVNALVPGHYRVEVTLDGFQPLVRGPLTLEVGQTMAVDVVLEIGKQTDAVNVVAVAPLIDSQSSNIGQT